MSVYSQIIHFADRLNRAGESLTDEETDWLEHALRTEALGASRSRKKGPPKKFWAVCEVRKLRRHIAAGKPLSELEPVLGRTTCAIHRKKQKLGLRCKQGSVARAGAPE